MVLDLRRFAEFPAEASLAAEAGAFKPFAEGVTTVGKVQLDLAIQKSGEEYFCQGEVTATYTVECSRCLAETEKQVSQRTEFIVCGTDQTTAHAAKGIDDEDYVYFRGSDLCADVTEQVRQALILSLPMKPLCSDNCRGLCPVCGVNLNKETCTCRKDIRDPRWEGLKPSANQDQ